MAQGAQVGVAKREAESMTKKEALKLAQVSVSKIQQDSRGWLFTYPLSWNEIEGKQLYRSRKSDYKTVQIARKNKVAISTAWLYLEPKKELFNRVTKEIFTNYFLIGTTGYSAYDVASAIINMYKHELDKGELMVIDCNFELEDKVYLIKYKEKVSRELFFFWEILPNGPFEIDYISVEHTRRSNGNRTTNINYTCKDTPSLLWNFNDDEMFTTLKEAQEVVQERNREIKKY